MTLNQSIASALMGFKFNWIGGKSTASEFKIS